jgi:hypothetical protein
MQEIIKNPSSENYINPELRAYLDEQERKDEEERRGAERREAEAQGGPSK